MINRTLIIVSIVSTVAFLLLVTLMLTEVLSFVNNVKYLVLIASAFSTFLPLRLFLHRQELPGVVMFIMIALILIPFLFPLFGLVNADFMYECWMLFIGGSIFQIGTGIFSLLGGFVKDGISPRLKRLNQLNYGLFIVLALCIVFKLYVILTPVLIVTLGVLISVLSLFLVSVRKPTASL